MLFALFELHEKHAVMKLHDVIELSACFIFFFGGCFPYCHVVNSGWSRLVTVEAFVVNIKGAALPDKHGLVQPLLKRWQAGACHYSVFSLPAVQAVLHFKWTTFAGAALMCEMCCFLAWLLSFSVFALVWQVSVWIREAQWVPDYMRD